MTDLNDLPDEVRQAIQAPVALNEEKLEALAKAIVLKRDEAVAARKASGIEEEWLAAEEAYLCIDDSNRGEFAGAKWAKPTSMDGPITASGARNSGVKSNAFVPMTPRYVDAGAAKLGEILLPIDDKAFALGPTPDPELIKNKSDLSALIHPLTGQPVMRAATPEEMQGPPPPGHVPGVTGQSMPQVPVTKAEAAEQLMTKAQIAAKAAERRIYDWMVESRYPAEMRKVTFDGARIGAGVLKGPFPDKRTAMAMVDGVLQITETIKPCVAWKDPWNCFPDPACGENIQDGDHFVERDFLSRKRVKDIKRRPGCIKANVDKVLAQGPEKSNAEGSDRPGSRKNDKRFVVWYFTGTLTYEEMQTAGVQDLPKDKAPNDDIFAIATMINDVLVHAAVNPLDSGKLPYHAFPWRRRPGHWAGVGVAEQIRTPQRIINAATRALLNNAGKSAGSQVVIDREGIEPADGNWTLTPDKVWYKKIDATADDIRKMFGLFEIPNMGGPLMNIVEYAFRLAEESTNIPLVTQGQSGKTTPETYGATQLQDNNANQLLRSIAYSTDDYITEPLVTMFYEWLLLDPEVPDEEKGDFQINAHGSIALVERAIQDETIAQMGMMVKDPAFGIDPKKWFAEFLKTKHLNPTTMQYSAEELAQIAKQPAPPPIPIAVAQIRAQADQQKTQATLAAQAQITQAELASEEKIATGAQQVQAHDINVKQESEAIYAQTEAQMVKDNASSQERLLMIKRDIAMLEYSNKNSMQLAQVKADLAKVSIQEQTKKDLAAAELQANATEQALDRQHDANKHSSSQQLDAATTLATHAHEQALSENQLKAQAKVARAKKT